MRAQETLDSLAQELEELLAGINRAIRTKFGEVAVRARNRVRGATIDQPTKIRRPTSLFRMAARTLLRLSRSLWRFLFKPAQ